MGFPFSTKWSSSATLAWQGSRSAHHSHRRPRGGPRLQLLHGDLCRPISPSTPSGNRYFLLLVNDFSWYMWIAPLPSKDGAAAAIKRIQAAVKRKIGKKLITLHTDRGGEFAATDFVSYCTKLGVHRHLIASYMP